MKKLLIVEDDAMLLDAYKNKFNGLEYTVQYASDGEEALVKVSQFIPDLILLDLVLPKKDGLEVLEEIKKSSTFKHIPVLITSNLDEGVHVEKGISLGAEDYIIKSSASLDHIMDMIKKRLEHIK